MSSTAASISTKFYHNFSKKIKLKNKTKLKEWVHCQDLNSTM